MIIVLCIILCIYIYIYTSFFNRIMVGMITSGKCYYFYYYYYYLFNLKWGFALWQWYYNTEILLSK
jgi:hypothetical protein